MKSRGRESTSGATIRNMTVNGLTIKCMGMGTYAGPMANNMKDSSRRTSAMARVDLSGAMAASMREAGTAVNRAVSAII